MENKYQISKTIRFGLTKKRIGKKHESHEVLDFLLKLSEEKIISVAGKASSEEVQLVKDVRNCLAQIKEYLKD
ncbi:MAG: hypothetical protein MJ215_00005, partial [Spirochaetia bacterium]|nr:hypothetical protein [Spirochaetia bacterium]